jgi:hypothetical protein
MIPPDERLPSDPCEDCPEDRQMLPGPAPSAQELCLRFAGESLCAAMKSVEILARSSRAWTAALFGATWTNIDDAFTDQRTRLSCRDLHSLYRLEAELAPRRLSEMIWRCSLLAEIAAQVVEDSMYPMKRRVDAAIEIVESAVRG